LEHQLKQAGGSFFVGGKLSIADLAVWNSIRCFKTLAKRFAHVSILKTYPKWPTLGKFYHIINRRPNIANYLTSSKCELIFLKSISGDALRPNSGKEPGKRHNAELVYNPEDFSVEPSEGDDFAASPNPADVTIFQGKKDHPVQQKSEPKNKSGHSTKGRGFSAPNRGAKVVNWMTPRKRQRRT
jgi:hypothetical protein